jgi:DNA-binding NarL/FixJ family response regulator
MRRRSEKWEHRTGFMALTRILIVDDHPIFRHGLVRLLNEQPNLKICAEAEDAKSALQAARHSHPSLAIVDIALPGTNGIDLTKMLRQETPSFPVLVVSMYKDTLYAERAMRAGAQGYVAKQEAADKLLTAIRCVLSGKTFFPDEARGRLKPFQTPKAGTADAPALSALSDRELQVFQLIGDGQSTRQIAKDLGLSVKTIESYRAHIKEKMNLESGYALVQAAIYWNHFQPKV